MAGSSAGSVLCLVMVGTGALHARRDSQDAATADVLEEGAGGGGQEERGGGWVVVVVRTSGGNPNREDHGG